jgi:hypothetical protein
MRFLFSVHPKDRRRRDAERVEECRARHLEVRPIVIRRHAAFVAEEEADAIPVELAAKARAREQLVGRLRRRAAGERDERVPSHALRERRRVGHDDQVRAFEHRD